MFDKADIILRRAPGWVLIAVALCFLLLVMLLDYATGIELSFSIFYLPSTFLVAWYRGRREAAFVSVAAAVGWYAADIAGGHVYSHPAMPVWNAAVRFGFFIISGMILSSLSDQLRLARSMAETDGLTGLCNSRCFYERLRQEAARSARYGRPFTLAYMDLDNFKHVNDSLGHETGDRVLVSFARTLKDNMRETDVVARIGGDEFVLLLPETGYGESAEALEKVRARTVEAMAAGGWPVTVSIGALTFRTPLGNTQEMITAADSLMYEVKREGKDRIIHKEYGPAPDRTA